MHKYNYTIIKSPIGFVIPIWGVKPNFSLYRISFIDSPYSITHLFLGLKFLGLDDQQLTCRLKFENQFTVGDQEQALIDLFNSISMLIESNHCHIEQLKKSLNLYFLYKTNIEFPLSLLHYELFSEFTRRVLLCLKNIPLGTFISYRGLAEQSGHPKAFRAVGSVMNKNPFPLIIPCHRVIHSNGSIGEYAFGKEMKKYLLLYESGDLKFEND